MSITSCINCDAPFDMASEGGVDSDGDPICDRCMEARSCQECGLMECGCETPIPREPTP